jgi:hypothetical protein
MKSTNPKWARLSVQGLLPKLHLVLGLGVFLYLSQLTFAAIVTEAFTDDDAGWFGVADLTVIHNASGYLQGTFEPGDFGGSFRADSESSGGDFVGNLTRYPTLETIRFDFMAEDVFPAGSALRFRGSNNITFSFGFSLSSIGIFQSFAIPVTYSSGWVGGTEAEFNAAFADVQWMDVFMFAPAPEINPSSSVYRLDNFEFSSLSLPVIPEPGHSLLMLLGFAVIMSLRSRSNTLFQVSAATSGLAAHPWEPDMRRFREPAEGKGSSMLTIFPRQS